jgi:acetyltransferase-like isoleucine patch superfamily enzyme
MRDLRRRLLGLAWTLGDPRAWIHLVRVLHFYSYSHVRERARISISAGAELAPNVSIRHGQRVEIGKGSRIGERVYLWAGPETGRISIGANSTLAPEVFITAADYGMESGQRILDQPMRERDVVIGDDVWLGARVFVTSGVTIGNGCVVGAGAVVSRDLPPNSVAVGVPARVVKTRGE